VKPSIPGCERDQAKTAAIYFKARFESPQNNKDCLCGYTPVKGGQRRALFRGVRSPTIQACSFEEMLCTSPISIKKPPLHNP
jgi:hypothetical protein